MTQVCLEIVLISILKLIFNSLLGQENDFRDQVFERANGWAEQGWMSFAAVLFLKVAIRIYR